MQIPLTQGRVATIDDADWPKVSRFIWYAAKCRNGRWYALASLPGGNRHDPKVRMHRVIKDAKPTDSVDHEDGDGLNNRSSNLRLCTNAQNQQNTGPRGGTSRFKGVSWVVSKGRWTVAFNWQGKTHFVGYFTDEIEAAHAYNAAILPLAGEFARLNEA